MNADIVPCQNSFKGQAACSCIDCPAVCASGLGDFSDFVDSTSGAAGGSTASQSWRIFGSSVHVFHAVWYIGLAVGYVAFIIAFGASNLYFYVYSPQSKKKLSASPMRRQRDADVAVAAADDEVEDPDDDAAAVAAAAAAAASTDSCPPNGVTFGMTSQSSRECFLPHQTGQPLSRREAALVAAKSKKSASSTASSGDASERICAGFDRRIESAFAAWGRTVAGHPVIVLTLGLLVCLVLSCGIIRFQVTTDPVDLWSAPDSTARQQKDYFDKHFG